MLKVTNRFHAPMKAKSIDSNNIQNKSQRVNFAGKISKKAIVGGIIGLLATVIVAAWGGLTSSKSKNNNLKREIITKVSSAKFEQISYNSDSIAINKPSFPFWYENANKYLSKVKASLPIKK